MENTFHMVAKTFEGLEEVLRDELIALGALNVEIGTRMVEFDGDLEMMYKANLCLRTALRILKPIQEFEASDPDELYDIVRDIRWEDYMTPESTFAIDSTVHSEEFRHSKYVTYRVKDGIADHFTDSVGTRPSIRLVGADLLLDVHISGRRVTISLNSSGESLSKRGYRTEQTQAPVNEVLAAGLILKTGWRGDTPLLDPMCGSGTFLIEAALIAANINPGIYRKEFAFERWTDFDPDLFEKVYNDDEGERRPPHPVMGGDIDAEAVKIARGNVANARVGDFVEIKWQSIADWTDNAPEGMLITNPPYGERLRPDRIEELYRLIGECLKKNFKGWHAWILGYRPELFDAIRLKSSVRYPVYNGALECSFREYVMFDGRYNDFRASGGEIKDAVAQTPQRPRPAARRKDFGERKAFRGAADESGKREFKPRGEFRRGFKPGEGGRDFKPKAGFKGGFKPKGEGRPGFKPGFGKGGFNKDSRPFNKKK